MVTPETVVTDYPKEANIMNKSKIIPEISQQKVIETLDFASNQAKMNLDEFTHRCQNHSSENNFYSTCENDQWTSGFWPGIIWLAYEHTGDAAFAESGNIFVESFLSRIINKVDVDHHDMGFLYTPSCVAPYKLQGNENAKKAAILAADNLLLRFHEKGEFLQAWGAMGASDNYRYIIDCLMNLPLLYWAGEQSGDSKYKEIADKHAATSLKHSIRDDGSTFHTVFMDRQTGEMVRGETCQGYSDDSFWARGQAWAVYGTAINYRYTNNPAFIDEFRRVLNFYLSKLPDDLVPYWDMIFTTGNEEPRDSSSASIVACGLLEMAQFVEGEEAATYISLAKQMMSSLVDNYSVKDSAVSNGLVLHATYSKKSPYNTCTPEGIDECTSWGDYFYMEALTRLSKEWDVYW